MSPRKDEKAKGARENTEALCSYIKSDQRKREEVETLCGLLGTNWRPVKGSQRENFKLRKRKHFLTLKSPKERLDC